MSDILLAFHLWTSTLFLPAAYHLDLSALICLTVFDLIAVSEQLCLTLDSCCLDEEASFPPVFTPKGLSLRVLLVDNLYKGFIFMDRECSNL